MFEFNIGRDAAINEHITTDNNPDVMEVLTHFFGYYIVDCLMMKLTILQNVLRG